MRQELRFVSMVPVRRARPGSALFKGMLAVCLAVVAVGLWQGQTLVAAVGPVGVALAYLLVRAPGPGRESADLAAEAVLTADPERIVLTWPDLDLADGRGRRAETMTFPVSTLREARCWRHRRVLVLDGPGEASTLFFGAAQPAARSVRTATVRFADERSLDRALRALDLCGVRAVMR